MGREEVEETSVHAVSGLRFLLDLEAEEEAQSRYSGLMHFYLSVAVRFGFDALELSTALHLPQMVLPVLKSNFSQRAPQHLFGCGSCATTCAV